MTYQLALILLESTGTVLGIRQMIKIAWFETNYYVLGDKDSEQSACTFYSLYKTRWAHKQSAWTHTSRVARS